MHKQADKFFQPVSVIFQFIRPLADQIRKFNAVTIYNRDGIACYYILPYLPLKCNSRISVVIAVKEVMLFAAFFPCYDRIYVYILNALENVLFDLGVRFLKLCDKLLYLNTL